MYDYDWLVIGSGPAGEKGAVQAAYFGRRVAVVEKQPQVGGACINTGTLPSKTLRETALYLSGFRQREMYGISCRVNEGVSVPELMCRQDPVTDTGVARRVTFDAALIAVGSSPFRPPYVPFEDGAVDDSDSILRLPEIPR